MPIVFQGLCLLRQGAGAGYGLSMVILMHWFRGRPSALAALACAAAASILLIGNVGADARSDVMAQAQREQRDAKSDRGGGKSPMERCMATWDRATQMSKQEWKETCKRTVKEYPDLFGKPF